MKLYKLVIAYDGTDYKGWQEQPKNITTVAKTLKNAFTRTFKASASIVAASRTDAGVHAMGQVARIRTEFDLNADKLKFALNNALPDDILITELESVDTSFHPMHNVVQKTYQYDIFTSLPVPFVQRYGWHCQKDINVEKLRECLKVFVGTHDFRSFCSGYEAESTVRTIDSIELVEIDKENKLRLIFKGKSFLQYMIRRIVGACVKVACEPDLQPSDLIAALDKKHPEQILPCAPAKGLMLVKIEYSPPGHLDPSIHSASHKATQNTQDERRKGQKFNVSKN